MKEAIIIILSISFLIVLYGVVKAIKSTFIVGGIMYSEYDPAIYTGSIRPDEAGILKYNSKENSWFMIYLDGFEVHIKDLKQIKPYKK